MVLGLIFQVCWAIWKTRNECVFSGVLPIPERIIDKAKLANSDSLHATFLGSKDSVRKPTRRERKWSPPPPSCIKFNCDGAYSSSHSVAAFGCLARESGGAVQFWRSGRVIASLALFTEAWAMRIACGMAWGIAFGMAWGMNITDALFESDCQVVIDCIRNEDQQCPWEIEALVVDSY